MLIVAVWLLTLVFPKAGFYSGDIPITIASVTTIVYGAWYFFVPGSPPKLAAESRRFTRWHLVFVWTIAVSVLVNLDDLTPIDATTWMLLAASPLVFHAGLRTKHPGRLLVVALISTVAVGLYALVQNIFGVTETAIPGLTHVAGENLLEDNPIRTPNGTLKSPSTYHNGNLAASFMIIGLGFALFTPRVVPKTRALSVLAVVGAVVGVAVSLSRSAVFAVALVALISMLPWLRPPWMGRRIATFASAIFIGAGSLVVGQIVFGSENFLVERFVGDAVEDQTAAGRTDGYARWVEGLGEQDPGEFAVTIIFGDGSIDRAEDKLEGIVWMTARYGIGAMVAMLVLLAIPVSQVRRSLGRNGTVIWFGLVASSAMWLVDNTYLFPPTLMNWFLLAGLAVQLSAEPERFETARIGEFITERRHRSVASIPSAGDVEVERPRELKPVAS